MDGIEYEFISKPYLAQSADMPCGWVFVDLPKEMSVEIRNRFKNLEQGWGRMKVTAKIGGSVWPVSIWFDTKAGTYLLSLKAAIRKKEKIELGKDINVTIAI